MSTSQKKSESRDRRRLRIRKRVHGTPERPRLTVFRSNKHIYAQVVDDDAARSLAATSTLDSKLESDLGGCESKVERAKVVGRAIGRLCIEHGISKVVFDRNGYLYHGRVSALAEGAREAGLDF